MMYEQLRHADVISIDHEDVREDSFEVDEVEVENLGVTQIVIATMFVGSETYALKGATHSDTAELKHIDTEEEWEIDVTDITVLKKNPNSI